MRKPIRVQTKSPNDKLDDKSRVNYGKLYSIDAKRDLKVYDFGSVHEMFIDAFRESFSKVWDQVVAQGDPYQDGLDDDENSGADDQDKGGHAAKKDSVDDEGSETE